MYWKIAEELDEQGNRWVIYNYYEITNITKDSKSVGPFYNGFTKEITYPQNKELVLKAAMADSEESFEFWYQNNKQL